MQYCKIIVSLLIPWGFSLILNFKFNSLITVCKNVNTHKTDILGTCNALELHLITLCYCSSINTWNYMWCNVYVRVNPRIRKKAIHKQWCQISWFGSKFHYLMIKMLYNRCTGIYKFGNNTYPWCIRRRLNLGHNFREKKCVLWAGKHGINHTLFPPTLI